jgi:hypothetical protein
MKERVARAREREKKQVVFQPGLKSGKNGQ